MSRPSSVEEILAEEAAANLELIAEKVTATLKALPPTRTLAAMLAPPMPSALADILAQGLLANPKMDKDRICRELAECSGEWAQEHADALLTRLKETEATT